MKKNSLLILLSMFLISCSSDCDCKKYKAKYKMHSTGEVLMDGVEIDSMKMKKMKKWKKARKDSIYKARKMKIRKLRESKKDSVKN